MPLPDEVIQKLTRRVEYYRPRIALARDKLNDIRDTPVPESITPKSEYIDPEDPRDTNFQVRMQYFWRYEGISTSAAYLKWIADRQATPSYQRTMSMEKNVRFLFATMHPNLVEAIIRGDLPFQAIHDPVIKKECPTELNPIDSPGNYAQYFAQVDYLKTEDPSTIKTAATTMAPPPGSSQTVQVCCHCHFRYHANFD